MGWQVSDSSLSTRLSKQLADARRRQSGYAINAASVGRASGSPAISLRSLLPLLFDDRRDFGPRVFLSCVGYESAVWTHDSHWWLYGPIVGTIGGALLGCLVYDICIFQGDASPLNRRDAAGAALCHPHRMVRKAKAQWRRGTPASREDEEGQLEKGVADKGVDGKQNKSTSAANSAKEAVQRRWARQAQAGAIDA